MVAMAAVVTLVFVICGLNALTPRVALSASVDTAVSKSKQSVTTSVSKVSGKSYLRVQLTSRYGTTKRFTVKQRVCVKSACRTVTTALSVSAGKTAWQGKYLGTSTYKKSGAPSVSAATPPTPSPAPRVTKTATVTTAPTVTATVRETVTVTNTVTATATATATVTATPTATATVTATPTATATVTVTATPTVTVTVTEEPGTDPEEPGPDPEEPGTDPEDPGTDPEEPETDILCGASANLYGFTYCSTGNRVLPPAANACAAFACIDYFPNGKGYLVMCKDEMVSLSGGIKGACSSHGGVLRTIYRTAA
ncbi:hypothetical protein [Streptosporangium sp. 'caverna']|uniref:hypothetical protein n=1 Tax=Streptosporangium sp. 'caverna' TaxID=2202249 RepID=UPI0013A6EC67|nr:hypothetical protein [Streptosporangium sp. 'caverna']